MHPVTQNLSPPTEPSPRRGTECRAASSCNRTSASLAKLMTNRDSTLTEEYTGLPVNQPFTLFQFVDGHGGAYVAQQT